MNWITDNYREAYGIYVCNGILFNHESGIRVETFVQRRMPQPIKEDYLHVRTLEPTNSLYAVAKIAGIEMCWSYNRQYGTPLVPTNPSAN
jgi:nucleoside-diphosphate-sugar epimerase